MRLGATMAPSDAAADNDSSKHAAALKCILPQYPGDEVLAHAGQLWLEQSRPRLADASLLAVAEGEEADGAANELIALKQRLEDVSSFLRERSDDHKVLIR